MTALPDALPDTSAAIRRSPVRTAGHWALRIIGWGLLAVIVLVLLLLAYAAVMRTQPVTLPAPTGQSLVGRTEIAMTDTSRVDPFATDGRKRELAVWIWYPAVAGSSEATAPYLPDAWAPLAADVPLSQDLTAVSTNAHDDAALDGRPPVVVLQPGLGMPVASYTTLAEDLASHGYAVIGINETGSAPAVFPDGHVVPAMPLGNVSEPNIDDWYVSAARVTNVWGDDAQFVVKQLEANPPQIGRAHV